jgi:pimeloyl-ACP methyl ester carboxylesterase
MIRRSSPPPRFARAKARALAVGGAALALTLALTACTSTSTTTAAPTVTSTGAASPVSTGTFTERPAAWTPCQSITDQYVGQANGGFDFSCATIQVPQDWHKPNDGKVYNIALVRARSHTQTNRIGSLLVDPGGPGASGIGLAVELADPRDKFPAAITNRFDLVGFDPRGVGSSTEVQCISAKAQDSLFGAEPDPISQADFDKVVALNKAAEAPCGTKYGSQLPLFSTEQAARDMDAIRVAVGDPKLTYLGYSYGTLLGAVYAQLFPTKVRAFVLDGAIDPKQDAVARSESQAAGFEHAFSDFSTWCKKNTAQCPISADPRGEVVAALNAARTSPVPGPDGRKATAGWIFTGVAQAMYAQSLWPAMASGIAQLKTGKSTTIFQLADEYAERSPDGQYSNLFDDNDAVNCADFASQPTLAQVRTYQTQWRKKYPLFGGPLASSLITCAAGVWPGTSDPYPTGAAVGAPPIVVVGTTGDPATPYAQTAKLASMLGNGHVITWEGEGHTAYPQTPCITNAVNAYLLNLTVPAKGLTCPAT